jgi:hypothetical protein
MSQIILLPLAAGIGFILGFIVAKVTGGTFNKGGHTLRGQKADRAPRD